MKNVAKLSEELTQIIAKQITLLARFEVECVIVGGVAATLHGSAFPTTDLDVCYARTPGNLEKLANALQSVHGRLRNAPKDLPFILDAETLRHGLNFTFSTDIGDLDLLGEIRGVGYYDDVLLGSLIFELLGHRFGVIDIEKLILAKRAAGRLKDMVTVAELEALLDASAH
jgi:hypothetical protein